MPRGERAGPTFNPNPMAAGHSQPDIGCRSAGLAKPEQETGSKRPKGIGDKSQRNAFQRLRRGQRLAPTPGRRHGCWIGCGVIARVIEAGRKGRPRDPGLPQFRLS